MSSQASSKYDYVKVKIWTGPEYQHFFVFSRFLLSRMLTAIRLDAPKAVRVALEVKKYFVDKEILNVPFDAFEKILFFHLLNEGFTSAHIQRYLRVSDFVSKRVPLVVLLAGPPTELRRTIAQALAAKLNMQNVQQSDVMYDLLMFDLSTKSSRHTLEQAQRSLCAAAGHSALHKYRQECMLMRRACSGDLEKALWSGKSVVLDGFHVDPALYIWEFGLLDEIEAKFRWTNTTCTDDVALHPKCHQTSNRPDQDILETMSPKQVEKISMVATVKTTSDCVAVCSARACMMLGHKPSASHTDDSRLMAFLREHCEFYDFSGESSPPADDLSCSMLHVGGDIATVTSSTPHDGMSVDERMRHWWGTRAVSDALHALDDKSSLNVAACNFAHFDTQARSPLIDLQTGESTAWFRGGGAHACDNSPSYAQSPTVLAQLEYAWNAVTSLELQRPAENEVLEQLYAGRPIVQGSTCPLPVFVPLVVKPHECDSGKLHSHVPGQAVQNAGAASEHQHLPTGIGSGVKCNGCKNSDELGRSRHHTLVSSGETSLHACCHVEDILNSYASYGIPVVNVHWGNYEDTLDALHDHVLCCIESSQMQRM